MRKITITIETMKVPGAFYDALDMLDPKSKFSMTSEPIKNGNGRGRDKQKRKAHAELLSPRPNLKNLAPRPTKYKDKRIVWDSANNKIDIAASLANINMGRIKLSEMVTKVGSIEHTLKMAIKGRGY